MKQNKITLLTLATIVVLGLMSCSKESFDVNDNPNAATDSTMEYKFILPSAQNNTGRIVARSWGWLQNYLGYWARSGTYAPNAQEETYNITTGFQTGIWSGLYDNLMDYQLMEIQARKSNAVFYQGIARIMKAHDFALLVDIYGNVPYSDALKGAGSPTPKYDNGVNIYKDLLRQIDTAIVLIKSADESDAGPDASLVTNDIMFGENLFPGSTITDMKIRWIQFANTMKLRILTKCMNGGVEANVDGSIGSPASYVSGIDIPAEIASINAEGTGFLDFDAQVQPGYASDKGNPFYNLYVRDNTGTATSSSVYYKANSYSVGQGTQADPGYYGYDFDIRRLLLYSRNGSGVLRGVEYGLPASTDNAATTLAGIGAGLYGGDDQPQLLLTAAESYFLQAECIQRGFTVGNGDAGVTLTDAINASHVTLFVRYGLDEATALQYSDAYITGNAGYPDVDITSTGDLDQDGNPDPGAALGGLFTIISQKWFALNGIAPFEVWSDYRRVDISTTTNHFVYGEGAGFIPGPAISVYPANSRTEIPVRLLYPQSEYQYNAANVGAQPSAGSYPFAHIFWDLN